MLLHLRFWSEIVSEIKKGREQSTTKIEHAANHNGLLYQNYQVRFRWLGIFIVELK